MKRILHCLVCLLMLALVGLLTSAPAQTKPALAHPKALPDARAKQLVQVPISDAPSYAKRALVVGVPDYALCNPVYVCGNRGAVGIEPMNVAYKRSVGLTLG